MGLLRTALLALLLALVLAPLTTLQELAALSVRSSMTCRLSLGVRCGSVGRRVGGRRCSSASCSDSESVA